MTNNRALDPLIHHPQRLRITATLAALPDGDTLSGSRLCAMLALTPAALATHLHELRHAGYLRMEHAGGDRARTSAALTSDGRAALGRYTAAARQLGHPAKTEYRPPPPGMRAGDADREAAAAALGEHYAQGRLTLDELHARLDATLTATTHGELSRATHDLPDLPPQPAPAVPQSKRARRPGQAPARRPRQHHRGAARGTSS